MRGQPSKRESKKPTGIFGEKKKENRHKRKWWVAAITGGIKWADTKVGRPPEWVNKEFLSLKE